MTAHAALARIARQVLRENFASIEDQADAMAAAVMTELREGGTAPLPERMRAAAEVVEQLNAMCGMGANCSVSPKWLRAEADRMEGDVA